jgi:ATP-dependent DNA helicase UvrD/PcrA
LVGGTKFYERKEIKDVLAYLKILLNPFDLVSLERAEKIGKRRLAAFQKWQSKQKSIQEKNPGELLNEIIETTSYLDRYKKTKTEENEDRIRNVQELLSTASQFDDIIKFLENVALVQDKQLIDGPPQASKGINLMSLHSAKGLEFDLVFMVGMEDGMMPHSKSLFDSQQMEEERRLCYVGITRARHKLIMTYAASRWSYGGSQINQKSRFLAELPEDLTEEKSTVNYSNTYYQNNKDFYKTSRWNPKNYQKQTASQKPKRRIILDEDAIDALLRDEINVDDLIK